MKKLNRFTLGSGHALRAADGEWMRADEALEAIGNRQAVIDVRTGERDRLVLAAEAGDRMRAFLADYLLLAQKSGDAKEAEEATIVAELWDKHRKATMGKPKQSSAEDIAELAKQHAESMRRLADK